MKNIYKNCIKRFIDIIFSVLIITLLLPILIVISIFLSYSNRGKVFFIQPRPGKNEKIFNIIKFKTMNDNMNKDGNLLPDIERLTTIGKILRKTSLDEIPQMINVLKGDMSIIGPRPLLVEYLPLYNEYQKQRHNLKPGITGWAQVNGRNAISWEKKFELDVWYVNNISLAIDCKILFLSFRKVFIREGINSSEEVIMNKFNGNL